MQMWFRNIIILFGVSFLTGDPVSAQDKIIRKDSTNLYENIESYSKRGRFSTFVYRLIFNPVAVVSKKKEISNKGYNKLIQKPYSSFEGKIIRNIDITTLDPFGYSTADTITGKQNILYAAGNRLHIKTHSITIRNLLLFHKNQKFSSLLVRESERLIRAQEYVHEVSFYVVSAGINSDSADIFIRELDKWSIIPEGTISASKIQVGITDKNFLGSGHSFKNSYMRNFNSGINSLYTNYNITNIRNSFITTKIHFGIDGYGNTRKSFAVDRPFYSPLAKWAAGVSLASQVKKDSSGMEIPVQLPDYLRYNTQDFWAGKAIRIFRGTSENELVTNLILSARFYNRRYSEKPSEMDDPMNIYSDEKFYLAGIGVSTRKYVQDTYIFKYGIIEDVPVGKVLELTGGYQVRNNSVRPYLGIRFSSGNYNTWGYLSTDLGYGTFFRSSDTEQGIFTAGLNYFTGLFEIGSWKFRQFVKPQIAIGINRFGYDSLTINDGFGLDGFNSSSLSGSKRITLTLQTQSYLPWNILGFHFGPFVICSLGMLGNAETGFNESKIYSQFGLGMLVKNFNLVFRTFQFSVSFYPSIPGIGQDIFKINSFRTSDFGFRDFETGKPSKVIFQ